MGRTNYVFKTLQFKTICPTQACTTPLEAVLVAKATEERGRQRKVSFGAEMSPAKVVVGWQGGGDDCSEAEEEESICSEEESGSAAAEDEWWAQAGRRRWPRRRLLRRRLRRRRRDARAGGSVAEG